MLNKIALRFISAKATLRDNNNEVQLRGKLIHGRFKDLPHLIWLPDLIEPVENFKLFFKGEKNKILDVRNVHLLNYRNFGSSDHHHSFDMDDISNDIIRYMDQNQITMATIGGHGFGAKVATATASNNLNRFTGVMCLDGGPVDQRYHEPYLELKNYVMELSKLKLEKHTAQEVQKSIDKVVTEPNWNFIFKQNLNTTKGYPQWDFNMEALVSNMKKVRPDVATWSERYGLWPGRAFVLLPAYSRWVHLPTNTLPFYDVFPRLQGTFPSNDFNIFGSDQTTNNHWPHDSENQDELFHLSNKMWRWLRYKDGCHVLLSDKTEAGWFYIQDRGTDASTGTGQGEITPEHVHYNWKYTHVYEKSQKRRGTEAAAHGQFLPKGQFSDESKW
eukprot:CAMPEP_0168343520 /NCGR_PEP_ID=MMETSP0213-20121227/16153_1 /TAXON_ID=151035 /ORGANISM="Euplotes harpa, Strain FSP1.4" /LENGTH=386 /DNA_ID=CAMNT_0008350853 /DNA_START=56 /DNA_END=1216 /DNA_ORIENTATION=+